MDKEKVRHKNKNVQAEIWLVPINYITTQFSGVEDNDYSTWTFLFLFAPAQMRAKERREAHGYSSSNRRDNYDEGNRYILILCLIDQFWHVKID